MNNFTSLTNTPILKSICSTSYYLLKRHHLYWEWLSILTLNSVPMSNCINIINTVCFMHAYIYICQQFCLHFILPTIALHEALSAFFMYLYVQVIIKKNNISLCKLIFAKRNIVFLLLLEHTDTWRMQKVCHVVQ